MKHVTKIKCGLSNMCQNDAQGFSSLPVTVIKIGGDVMDSLSLYCTRHVIGTLLYSSNPPIRRTAVYISELSLIIDVMSVDSLTSFIFTRQTMFTDVALASSVAVQVRFIKPPDDIVTFPGEMSIVAVYVQKHSTINVQKHRTTNQTHYKTAFTTVSKLFHCLVVTVVKTVFPPPKELSLYFNISCARSLCVFMLQ